jgi:hypothetical protein
MSAHRGDEGVWKLGQSGRTMALRAVMQRKPWEGGQEADGPVPGSHDSQELWL